MVFTLRRWTSNAHVLIFREPSGKKKSGKEMIFVPQLDLRDVIDRLVCPLLTMPFIKVSLHSLYCGCFHSFITWTFPPSPSLLLSFPHQALWSERLLSETEVVTDTCLAMLCVCGPSAAGRFLGGQGLSFVLRPCVMCMAVWWWWITGGPFSREFSCLYVW